MNSNDHPEQEFDWTEEPETTLETDERSLQPLRKVFPLQLTILPLLRRPVFPGMPLPLNFVGKEALRAIQHAVKHEEGYIGLVLARPPENGEPSENGSSEGELFEVGTVFKILRVAKIANDTVQIIGQGYARFKKVREVHRKPTRRWEVRYHEDPDIRPDPELKAYMLAISAEIKNLLQLNPLVREQVNLVISQLNFDTPGLTMDIIANLMSTGGEALQEMLETFDLKARARKLLQLIKEELEVAKIQQRIQKQIEEKVNRQQKEFFLREQLKAIKKELGIEKEEGESEIEKIERKLAEKELPEEAQKVVEQELDKLRTLNAQSPDFNVTRNYLELIADLPWGIYSEDNHDLRKARRILDRDHYGLKDVKSAILEFLSSVTRRGRVAGSIICLVGPPGVGKTSIGKSVAEALNRKFFRFSVGGMRDEAEIKGHRRTYIGAMPGKLIQALKRAGTSNPVIMLDEIDKIGSSFHGDPASALLEVLDPEQNTAFLDHYLDIPYDLSNVLFITTANQLDTIPGPLLDRMEVIRLSGYILEEKLEIARQYLIPKQLAAQGFEKDEITFSEEAIRLIIDRYAREAGVRNLEKLIRKIIRKVAMNQALRRKAPSHIEPSDVEKMLGKPIFTTERLYKKPLPGVVLGLAYTPYGGATLYVEATAIRTGSAGFKRTGQLGNVMQESAEIAYSYARALLSREAPDNKFFDEHLIHLHVPAGATPKDGPSAGITMALALYSLAKNQPVKDGIAMTGELTLTGRVLPIGGVKEKTIAAKRVGIAELIMPLDNKRDFAELPAHIRKGLKVHFVESFDEVLRVAFPKRARKRKEPA